MFQLFADTKAINFTFCIPCSTNIVMLSMSDTHHNTCAWSCYFRICCALVCHVGVCTQFV